MVSSHIPVFSLFWRWFAGVLVIGTGMFALYQYQFLLYHSLVGAAKVVIAGTIFVIGWNTRRFARQPPLLLLAVAHLVIAGLDALHTLAYLDTGLFHSDGPEMAAQLWLATRFIEAGSFLMAASNLAPRLTSNPVRLLIAYICAGALVSIPIVLWPVFPTCFYPDGSPTTFTLIAQTVIVIQLLLAGHFFWRRRAENTPVMQWMFPGAIGVTVLSVIFFAVCALPDAYYSFFAHALKALAMAIMYVAFIRGSLLTPYESIFHSLERERTLFRATLEQMPSGVIVAEAPSGRIAMVNDQTPRILRQPITAADLSGRQQPWAAATQVFLSDSGPLARALHRGESTACTEITTQLGDGQTGTLRVSATPIRNPQGEVVAAVAVFDDITEHKRIKAALQQAEKQRIEIQSRFLQVAAHELRNPMTAVRGVASILQRRLAAGKPISELPQLILREVDRLSVMLDEMLEAFRLQRGKVAVHRDVINLHDLVEASLAYYRARENSDRFIVNLPAHQRIYVQGDALRLEDVLKNLVGNAVRYSPPGTPIRIDLKTDDTSVIVSITDNGIGIPQDQLHAIFSGFFRASNVATCGPAGLGLGLYMCSEILKRHHGRIWAESTEGRGSTFHVQLPIHRETQENQVG